MTINLNGVEFYSAQEVEVRIREAVAGKDKKEGMENLPKGTIVKVVGNTAGHCHNIGEILPITEVGDNDEFLYRLDSRQAGWVAVEDIEFVSFPEEEESNSGDEGLTVDDICEGESVKFLVDHTDGYGDTVQKGHCATVIAIQDGDILIGTPTWQSVKHEDIPTVLTKFDEDEEETELEFKVGDKVRVKGADYHNLIGGDIGTIRKISEHMKHTHTMED